MYTESDLARTYYDLGVTLDGLPGAELACADNATLANSSWSEKANPLNASEAPRGEFRVYDFTHPDTRDRWVARVADLVGSGAIDGAFIDGNRGGWSSSATACASDAARAAWALGLNASTRALRAAVGDATLISNYPTSEALRYATGGMIERFTPNQDIDELQGLAKRGSLVAVHAQYATEPHLSKHLAAFLVGMGERSYFGAGVGWDGDGANACDTWLRRWDEFEKPLGKPTADAAVVAGAPPKAKWTRSFGSGTHVLLDTTPERDYDTVSCIWWSDGTVTSGDPFGCNGTAALAGTPLADVHAAWLAAHGEAVAATPFAPRTLRMTLYRADAEESSAPEGCGVDGKVYDLPALGTCYSPPILFPGDGQWGAFDVRDAMDGAKLRRAFFNTTDGTCGAETDHFEVPLDACVGPFGPPRPWGRFAFVA